jgi:hypothetical protein
MRRVFGKHLIRSDRDVRVLGPGAYYGPGGIGELRGARAGADHASGPRRGKGSETLDVSKKLAETSFN